MSSAINLADPAIIASIEVTKACYFVDFIQRRAPGTGDIAAFTSELTKGIKDQVEKTGSCPFVGVYDVVSGFLNFHLFDDF
jgi:hypothetical protein